MKPPTKNVIEMILAWNLNEPVVVVLILYMR